MAPVRMPSGALGSSTGDAGGVGAEVTGSGRHGGNGIRHRDEQVDVRGDSTPEGLRRDGEARAGETQALSLDRLMLEEVSSLKLVRCGEFCGPQSIDDAEFAVRAGGGLDFRWVGFRVGVDRLSSNAFRRDVVLIPDLSLRLGSVDQGYFTVGFGAYDAQTTVRPGLYCGAGGQLTPDLSMVVHVGVHDDQDWVAFRGDATFEFQLTRSLSLGAGVGLQFVAFQSHLSVAVRLN
jgi:hypothetical protein